MIDFISNNLSFIVSFLATLLTAAFTTLFSVDKVTKIIRKKGEQAEFEKNIEIKNSKQKYLLYLRSNEDIEQDSLIDNQDIIEELYEKRRTDKQLKKISFILAVIMSITGTAILFVGIVVGIFVEIQSGWIASSSGAIVELIAGVYFWLFNRTTKEVRENGKQLEKHEDLRTALALAEKIKDDSIKNDVYKKMIEKLINSHS